MPNIILWTLIFSISTAASITLLGDRNLVSGNLFNIKTIVNLITNSKFISSLILAIFARISFIMINNAVLKIPKYESSATSIAALVSATSFIFVIASNIFFLKESFSPAQIIGASLIIGGVFIVFR